MAFSSLAGVLPLITHVRVSGPNERVPTMCGWRTIWISDMQSIFKRGESLDLQFQNDHLSILNSLDYTILYGTPKIYITLTLSSNPKIPRELHKQEHSFLLACV